MIYGSIHDGAITVIPVVLVTGLVLQPTVLALMRRRRVIDTPNERSSHTTPTPRGGGLAVVLAATVGIATLRSTEWTTLVPLIGYAALGLVEDVRGVRVRVRLACQILIGLVSGALLIATKSMSGPLALMAILILTIWLTTYVNAFNFMDGVNGIAASHAMVGGLAYAAIGLILDLSGLVGAGLAVAAAALTFLPWNAGKARIFLGDVGSYGLGGVLAALAGYAVLHGASIEAALFPLALYLADTGWTLVRRIRGGEAWHRPHRTHVYQRLTDVGFSHPQVAFGTATVAAALSACGLLSLGGTTPLRIVADVVTALTVVLYLNLPRMCGGRLRLGATR